MKFYRLEKENNFKKWAYNVFRALAFALLAIIVILLLRGYKFMIVSSGSMGDVLPVGSLIIVTPCEYEDLELNDIVTMDAGGINLTHRIVGKVDSANITERGYLLPGDEGYDDAGRRWVTKGDASDTLDGPLTKTVIGKVEEHHAFPWVGLMVRYVKANYTMLIVLLILAVAFISIIEWMKSKLERDDIECYESEEEE